MVTGPIPENQESLLWPLRLQKLQIGNGSGGIPFLVRLNEKAFAE